MIGKIVTGKSFKGAVEYVMNKPGARLIACDGVNATDARNVTRSFNFQRKARPEKAEVVGHISLSFHRDDAPKLNDDFMRQLAAEYMQRMNITDTQYIVVRHHDTGHPHIHILYNRVKYNAKLVKRHNEQIRNVAVCKAMKRKYGLTFSEGKENVKVEKLHGPDQVKYAIYGAIKEALPRCLSLAALADELGRQGIATAFVHRGGDPEKEVQGLTFTKNAITFKASQVDRKFSYANLNKTVEQNKIEAETQREKEQPRTPKNPVVFGVRLNDEQVQKIRDGQYIYLENMTHGNRPFSGYFVADDGLNWGRTYQRPPDETVRYGRFKMRIMDRDLIEQGFVVRALVEWYGSGQTARPYLWKEKPTDTDYKESWNDPRKPQNMQRPAIRHVPDKPRRVQKPGDNTPKRKKSRGI